MLATSLVSSRWGTRFGARFLVANKPLPEAKAGVVHSILVEPNLGSLLEPLALDPWAPERRSLRLGGGETSLLACVASRAGSTSRLVLASRRRLARAGATAMSCDVGPCNVA